MTDFAKQQSYLLNEAAFYSDKAKHHRDLANIYEQLAKRNEERAAFYREIVRKSEKIIRDTVIDYSKRKQHEHTIR
jgi:hypothetical protein